jgi:hypothetical protein
MSFEQAGEASTLDDVADFLMESDADKGNAPGDDEDDQGSADHDDDTPADGGQGDDDSEDDDRQGEGSESDEDDEPDDAKGSTSDLTVKVKVPVKGENGAADSFKEVTLKELVDGNMMREDYTRKTQDLAARERQALDTMTSRLNEGMAFYKQRAEFAMQAITQLADLKDEAQMFALARQMTPAEFQAEQQRQAFVRSMLGRVQQQMQQDEQTHKGELDRQQQAARTSAMQACWGALGHHGINGEMVKGAFEHAMKSYGVPAERFENISDPALVRIMVAAHKWDMAESKAKTVTKEAKRAPVIQTQRQQPPQRRADKRLEQRFSSGRANVKDLAESILRSEQPPRRGGR